MNDSKRRARAGRHTADGMHSSDTRQANRGAAQDASRDTSRGTAQGACRGTSRDASEGVPDRERLLARIRKLYAMSQATESSPHEAEIALRRCESLMRRFGITEADLESPEFGTSTISRRYRAIPTYVQVLASAVGLLHDCLVVKGDGIIEFRGFDIDTRVATLTNDYLGEAMERSLAARKREGTVPPGRSSSFDYRVAFALSVLERVQELDRERRAREQAERDRAMAAAGSGAPGTSLITDKLALVERNCSKGLAHARTKRVRYRNSEAHAAGSRDGRRVSLESQVGSAGRKALPEH